MEMPRFFSSSIQSDVVARWFLRAVTEPASWTAPPYSSSFSVNVVLPASGCEMMANVRRFEISSVMLTKVGNGNRETGVDKPGKCCLPIYNRETHELHENHSATKEHKGRNPESLRDSLSALGRGP